jgi:hypothetical protein
MIVGATSPVVDDRNRFLLRWSRVDLCNLFGYSSDSIVEYVSYMTFNSYVVMMSDWYEKAGLVEVVRKVKQHATQHI